MADFLTAYRITCRNEGGYVNDPDDAGGETYCGITRKNFPGWPGWPAVSARLPLRDGAVINNADLAAQVQDFYKQNFWDACHLDDQPDQDLANQVFDMAVNAGVGEALKLLAAA